MNAQHYEEWFRKILAHLPKNSVIVMDQAPYHTMIHPNFKNPTTGWRKEQIIEWMENQAVPLPPEYESFSKAPKPVLLSWCKPHHHEKIYLLEMIAQEVRDDVKILWLPVAHCEFNPIELVWAYVKNKVASENKTFNINEVYALCLNTMESIPSNLWENCVKHALKFEDMHKSRESRLLLKHLRFKQVVTAMTKMTREYS